MATSTSHGCGTVKEDYKPKVDIKQTRAQLLRQKHAHKSTPTISDSDSQKSKKKKSALETSKSEIKSKSATQLTSTETDIGHTSREELATKEKDKDFSSGVNKRKKTKTVTIKDLSSPRTKRREIVSESESSPRDLSSPRTKRREIVSESESSPRDLSSPRTKRREIVSESESSPRDLSSPRTKRREIVSESESSPKQSPRIKRKEILSDCRSSPVQSPRGGGGGGKTVRKAHSNDALHAHVTPPHVLRLVKHGALSSMSHLSDSRSSVHSDMSTDSFVSGSASGSGSKSSSNLSASDLFDRRFAMKLTCNLKDTSKTICVPAQIVTDRLYTPTNANEKRDFLRRKQWQLPNPQRRSRKDQQSPKKKRLSVIKTSSSDDIHGSGHVYDWLNRSAHSDTDLSTTLSLKKTFERSSRRRHSDPLGCKNGPCFVEYDHDIDDGFQRDGVRFLREYFSKDLVWLSNQVDLFLSNINLSPVYPSTTNEESYLTLMRPTVFKPNTQEDLYDVSAATDKAEVDIVDAVVDVVGINDAEKMKLCIPQMVDAWTVTLQQVIMCDVSTMTPRPRMCSKTTLTEPAYRDQATSTDDIPFKVKHEQSTSTADMFDLHIGSPIHPASPTSDVESSAYGSYESGNLRKQMHDRGSTDKSEGFSQTNSEFSLKLDDDSNIEKTKSKLTEEATSRIQSELNRLARERIEIIELFVLNVGNMSSTFTEELLEAKLNYSIGQTDSLLALLEEAWNFEEGATSTPRENDVCRMNHEIIEQSRSELEYSKRVIKLCIDEVKDVNSGGSTHISVLEEIKKMKRKAEIEAFKLERMWEQLLYERSKKGKRVSDSVDKRRLSNVRHSSSSSRETSKQGFTDSAAAIHLDNSTFNDSVDSYLAVPGSITPKAHKDHLVELRRLLIAEQDYSPRTSRSRSSYSGHHGRMTSSIRLSHSIYPSRTSYSSSTYHSPDKYRLSSDAYRSSFYTSHSNTYRDPVPMTSTYDKYKPYTGRYQTTIK